MGVAKLCDPAADTLVGRLHRRRGLAWRPSGELPPPTRGGTTICENPLLLVPDAAAPVEIAPETTDVLDAVPQLPPRAVGMVTEILGQYLRAPTAARDPVFTPDGELLEIGPGTRFDRDPQIARCCAGLRATRDGVLIEDFGAPTSIDLRAAARLPLRPGDRLRVGRQLLRFHALTAHPADLAQRPHWGRVAVMLDANRESAAYPLREAIAEIGRDRGDVQFPFDPSVGDPHCWIERDPDDGPILITQPDGPPVYVRLAHGDLITYDSELLVGDTRLRVRRLDAVG